MSKVIVTIDQFGRPSAKAEGFSGGACKEPISKIAGLLGGESQISDTSDMLAIDTETTQEHQTEYGY